MCLSDNIPKFLADYARELKTIPNWCPLPSIDDKMRDAYRAGQNSVSVDIDANGWVVLLKPDYEEWKEKQK